MCLQGVRQKTRLAKLQEVSIETGLPRKLLVPGIMNAMFGCIGKDFGD